MGTCATISVSDQYGRFSVYQHYDGYPDSELGIISKLYKAQRLACPGQSDAGDFMAAIIAILKCGPTMLDRGLTTYLTSDAESYGYTAFHYELEASKKGMQLLVLRLGHEGATIKERTDKRLFSGTIDEAIKHFRIDVKQIDTGLLDYLQSQKEANTD